MDSASLATMVSRVTVAGRTLDDDAQKRLLVDLADWALLNHIIACRREQAPFTAIDVAMLNHLGQGDDWKNQVRLYSKAAYLSLDETAIIEDAIRAIREHSPSTHVQSIDAARADSAQLLSEDLVHQFLARYIKSRARDLDLHLILAQLSSDSPGLPIFSKEAGSIAASQFRAIQEWQSAQGESYLSALAETAVVIAEFFQDLNPPEFTDVRRNAIEYLRRDEAWIGLTDDPHAASAMWQVAIAAALLSTSPTLNRSEMLRLLRTARGLMMRSIESDDAFMMGGPILVHLTLREARLQPRLESTLLNETRALVARLIARAARIDDSDLRMPILTGLFLFGPVIDLIQGRYDSALDGAASAKELATQWQSMVVKTMQDLEREIRDEENSFGFDPDDRQEIAEIRNVMSTMAAGPAMALLGCEALALQAKAEGARRSGDLEASAFYLEQAWQLYRDLQSRFLAVVSTVLPGVVKSLDASTMPNSQKVTTLHLQAMVDFANADALLLRGAATEAVQVLDQAQVILEEADHELGLWMSSLKDALSRSSGNQSTVSINSAIRKVLDGKRDNASRRRYASAKRGLALAAALSAAGRHKDSASAYQLVLATFDEMTANEVLQLPAKLAQSLGASKEYAAGCIDVQLWLLSEDKHGPAAKADFASAMERLRTASAMFAACDERHWADAIDAYRMEHEALYYSSAIDRGDIASSQLALTKAREAQEAYRRLNMADREAAVTSWIRELERGDLQRRILLPGPPLPLPGTPSLESDDRSELVNWRMTQVDNEGKLAQLRSAQARLGALQRRLDDLKERRDSGRMDDGRYTDFASSLETEMYLLLQDVKQILHDEPSLGPIVVDMSTVQGSDEDRQELERIAEQRQDHKLLNQIRRGGKVLLESVIEAGIKVLASQV